MQDRAIDRHSLKLIKRQETSADTNKKLIYIHYKVTTIKRYTKKVVGVFCYL